MSGFSTLPRKIEIGDYVAVSIQVQALVIDRKSGIISLDIMMETVPERITRTHRSLWKQSPRK